MKTKTLVVCFIAFTNYLPLQSQTLDKKFASTNGPVYTAVQNGDTVYIGGDFTQVGIGKKGLARFNANTDKPQISFPELGGNDKVNVMEPDGTGGFYLSGSFDSYNGKTITETNIIHVLSDGSLDNSFGPVTIGEYWLNILALKKVKSRLYVGGSFQTILGANRPYLAALNASTGVLQNWVPNTPDNWVLQIDANDSWVFANVSVEIFGRHVPDFCMALNASTGKILSNFPDNNGVTAFKIDSNTLYMGGNFTEIGSQSRDKFAAIDISNNSFNIKSWHPSTAYYLHSSWTDNTINSFCRYKKNLFIGGSFVYDDGVATSNNIIAFDTEAGNVTYNFATQYPASAFADNSDKPSVSRITIYNNKLFVSGDFQNIYNGNNIIAAKHYLASYNLSNFSLDTNENYEPNDILTGMFTDTSGNLFTCGNFSLVNYVDRESLAAINLNTGMPTSFAPNPYISSDGDGHVSALTLKDETLFVGGSFTNIGTNALQRNNLAAVNINNGQAISWAANTDDEVKCLAIKGTSLYVGGIFTHVKGTARNHAAAVSTNASTLQNWNPDFNNTINAILIDDDSIYVGGTFTKVGSKAKKYLAKVDTISGKPSPWNPAPNSYINTLIKDGTSLYVGGAFKTISTKGIYSVAKFSLAADTIFTLFDAKLRNASAAPLVHGLGLWANTLFVGATAITKINGVTRGNIAGININNDSATAFNPKPDDSVTNLFVGKNKLFAGGNWSSLGTNVSPSFFAVFTLEPQTQASNLNFINLQAKSVTANFTAGSGENRLVVIKQGSVPVSPADGKSYTANNVFGKGDVTGAGSYVVYAGSGTSVHITNLLPNHSYTVNVYEYNGAGSGSDYLTSPILSDSFSTPCLAAVKPGKITGKANNLCDGVNNVKYTIDTVANAKSYTWSVPKNCTIVSGRGTVSIKVNFPSNFNTGYITVKAVDSCGNSSVPDSLKITSKPAVPSKITGPTTVSAHQVGLIYSVTNTAGLTYTWTVPADATITAGLNTNRITVTWGAISGSVAVYASNSCGNSPTKSLAVNVSNGFVVYNNANNMYAETLNANVYPNPAQTQCTVIFNAEKQSKYIVEIKDAIGKVVMRKDVSANFRNNFINFDINKLASGFYIISIINNGNSQTLKLVKK